jgi:hypothetical protein
LFQHLNGLSHINQAAPSAIMIILPFEGDDFAKKNSSHGVAAAKLVSFIKRVDLAFGRRHAS